MKLFRVTLTYYDDSEVVFYFEHDGDADDAMEAARSAMLRAGVNIGRFKRFATTMLDMPALFSGADK